MNTILIIIYNLEAKGNKKWKYLNDFWNLEKNKFIVFQLIELLNMVNGWRI